MAGVDVNIWPSKDVEGVTKIVEQQGLDGLLRMVILGCEVMARSCDLAGDHEGRQLWKARVWNAKGYCQMAKRTEGRS